MCNTNIVGGELVYKKFEKLLKDTGKTAYQVSKDTGIATATLTEWKNGTYTPKADKLLKIAEYFGVSIEYFLK
jgi:repressor LexA